MIFTLLLRLFLDVKLIYFPDHNIFFQSPLFQNKPIMMAFFFSKPSSAFFNTYSYTYHNTDSTKEHSYSNQNISDYVSVALEIASCFSSSISLFVYIVSFSLLQKMWSLFFFTWGPSQVTLRTGTNGFIVPLLLSCGNAVMLMSCVKARQKRAVFPIFTRSLNQQRKWPHFIAGSPQTFICQYNSQSFSSNIKNKKPPGEKNTVKMNSSSSSASKINSIKDASTQQQNIKPTTINLNEEKKLERVAKLRCMNDLLKVIENHTFEEKKKQKMGNGGV